MLAMADLLFPRLINTVPDIITGVSVWEVDEPTEPAKTGDPLDALLRHDRRVLGEDPAEVEDIDKATISSICIRRAAHL